MESITVRLCNQHQMDMMWELIHQNNYKLEPPPVECYPHLYKGYLRSSIVSDK